MMRAKNSSGYTLVEVLVALAVFSLLMIGILNLLDNSSKLTQIETALADTQENVRFAAYHIMRTARMTGGADIPFAVNDSGTASWAAGELRSNRTGTITIPFGNNVTVLAGSDVLILRGFFELSPFFTNPSDFSSTAITIRESNTTGVINNFTNISGSNLFQGRGIVFMGRGGYAVQEVAAGSGVTGTGSDRVLTINLVNPTLTNGEWADLNPPGVTTPAFEVYRAGILESYTYYVDPNQRLMRMRADSTGGQAQPVAINIGGLQVALGVDTTADPNGIIDSWMSAPTAANVATARGADGVLGPSRVRGIRITVLGRTPFGIPDWNEPVETFQVEDMTVTSVIDRTAKWRRIQVATALRNYLL